MPILPIVFFSALFIGSQIDNAVKAKFGGGTVVQPSNDFHIIQIAAPVAVVAFVFFGIRKLLK